MPARQSKLSSMILRRSWSLRPPVAEPYESTKMERGAGTPMAYDSWTRQRLHRPAETSDLAIQRQ
eukprot:925438-Rhodomonas_salina.1